MVGYPESLTDPSYNGQILVLTFPLIGNYGVPEFKRDKRGIPEDFESEKIWPIGLIVGDLTEEYSHWAARRSLSEWLKEEGIPGICGMTNFMYCNDALVHSKRLHPPKQPPGFCTYFQPGSWDLYHLICLGVTWASGILSIIISQKLSLDATWGTF